MFESNLDFDFFNELSVDGEPLEDEDDNHKIEEEEPEDNNEETQEYQTGEPDDTTEDDHEDPDLSDDLDIDELPDDETDAQSDEPNDDHEDPDLSDDTTDTDNETTSEDNTDGGEDNHTNPDLSDDGDEADKPTDDTSVDDNDEGENTGEGGTDPEKEMQDLENSIFDSMSENDKEIRILELKNMYTKLFDACIDIEKKLDSVNKTEYNIPILKRLSTTLIELKTFIMDYLDFKFDITSYFDNSVTLHKYISIFTGIKNVLVQLNKEKGAK